VAIVICEDLSSIQHLEVISAPFTTSMSVNLRVDLWQAIPFTQTTQAAISIQILTSMTTVK
jgi:hypothetical protein